MNKYVLIFVGGLVAVSVGLFLKSQNSEGVTKTKQTQGIVSTNELPQQVNSQTSTVGEKAPDFSLSTIDGGTISLSEFQGKKPVVLDFWTSWCPNCRRDMPKLSKMYEKYKDKIEVIGINLQENPAIVERYISSADIVFPIALDPSGQASSAYDVRYTNTHVLIDKDGNIVKTIPGDIRESDIISLIQ